MFSFKTLLLLLMNCFVSCGGHPGNIEREDSSEFLNFVISALICSYSIYALTVLLGQRHFEFMPVVNDESSL